MRRNWIKIYPEGFLRRTLFKELLPIERWVWIGFLCLAGDNALDGKICLTENMGYTDEQLARLLDTNIDILKVSKKKMIKFEKISVDKNNVIQILNWDIYQSEYGRQKQYRQATPESRLNYRISIQIYDSLKSNKGGRHWENLVDYTLDDLKIHLKSKFKKDMTWQNIGKWHIDHIIPKSSFKFKNYNDEAFKQCWALENLQPLWAEENLQKSNKGLQRGVTTRGYNAGLQRGVTTRGYNAGLHTDRDRDREEDIDIKKEKKEKKEKNIYVYILNLWNSKKIIVHEKTDELLESIEKIIKKKKYKKDNIIQAIKNYSIILNDKKYFFKYIWSLENFLSRGKALPSFLDGGENWENYKQQNKDWIAIQEAKIKEKEWEAIKEKRDDCKHEPIPTKVKKQIHKTLNILDRNKSNKDAKNRN